MRLFCSQLRRVYSHEILHFCLIALLGDFLRNGFFLFSRSQVERAPAPLHLGEELLLDVVRVEHPQLDNPPGLEEEDGGGYQAEDGDQQLDGSDVPGLDEVEEDDGRNHEEQGDYVVGEAEAPGEGESWLGAAAAAAAVAAAAVRTHQTEGERCDKGHNESMWKRVKDAEELLWFKTHEWNQTQK